ncbi:hypothetical protein [Paenibacillus periandrae]|uniref:hypothetical protein n=1 Tax=Paenibacillus periandrae TaxID=1761741 RepID=UPI001F089169|nr:hypothetical protein [Paenibacillus periandrae]
MKLSLVQIRMMDAERFSPRFSLDGWSFKGHNYIGNALIGSLSGVSAESVTRKLRELKHLIGGKYIQVGFCYEGIVPKEDLILHNHFEEHPSGFLLKESMEYRVTALPCDAGGYWILNIMNKQRRKGLEDFTLDPMVFLQHDLKLEYLSPEVAI